MVRTLKGKTIKDEKEGQIFEGCRIKTRIKKDVERRVEL